jgi:hypothetical protein
VVIHKNSLNLNSVKYFFKNGKRLAFWNKITAQVICSKKKKPKHNLANLTFKKREKNDNDSQVIYNLLLNTYFNFFNSINYQFLIQ